MQGRRACKRQGLCDVRAKVLSFLRRVFCSWCGDVWKGEAGGREAGQEAGLGSRMEWPDGEMGTGQRDISLSQNSVLPLCEHCSHSTCRALPPTRVVSESHSPADRDTQGRARCGAGRMHQPPGAGGGGLLRFLLCEKEK